MADKPLVIDGDTIRDRGRTIRDFGADTPETSSYSRLQPGGFQATENAERLLEDGYSQGESQGETYGREVRSVKTPDGRRLADEQISSGLASTTKWGDSQHDYARMENTLGELYGKRNPYAPKDEGEELRASARRQEARQLANFVNGRYDGRLAASSLDDVEAEGRGSRAWDRGVAELQASGFAFLDALGGVSGNRDLQAMGREGVERAMLEAIENPADIGSTDEVESLGDAFVYGLETLIAETPSLALDAGVGVLTGGSSVAAAKVGKAFVRRLGGANAVARVGDVTRGAFARNAGRGVAASMYAQNAGETQLEQQGVGVEDPTRALLVGGVKTGLDYASFKGILGDVADRFKAGESVDTLGKWFGGSLAAVGAGAGREGPTEMVQTLVDELNKVQQTDGDYEVSGDALFESLVAGGVIGGTLGGAGGAAGNTYQFMTHADRQSADPERPEEETADGEPLNRPRRTRSWAGEDSTLSETTPEAPSDLAAQVAERPDGVTYVAPANVEDGVTVEAMNDAYQGGELQWRELPDGGMYASTSEAALAAAPENPTEAEQAETLGYAQEKGEAATADPVVVENRNAEGRVTRDQVVSRERAETVAAESGGRVRPVAEAQADRAQRYEAEVAALRQAKATRQSPVGERMTQEQVGEDMSTAERRAARREVLKPEKLPKDVRPLIEEAEAAGIEPSEYITTEAPIDAPVLRRELQSRLRESLPDDPDRTLRDALGERRLSDLEIGELREVARLMRLRDLPKALTSVGGNRSRFRSTAIASAARKVNEWKQGFRQDTEHTATDRQVPSDMTALARVLPEVGQLRREAGSDYAQYQADVKRALPTQGELRKRLAAMDDSQLYQATQLLRSGFKAPDGVELKFEAPRPDTDGLRAAIESQRMQGEGGSRDTRTEADQRREQQILEAEDVASDQTQLGSVEMQDAAEAAMIGAAYGQLTGETGGANQRAAMAARRGGLDDGQLAEIRTDAFDGDRLVRAVSKQSTQTEAESKARAGDWQQLALASPTQFAADFGEALGYAGLDPLDFQARADTTQRPKGETRGPAEAKSDAPSGVDPGTAVVEPRFEQDASDGPFFIGLLDGARFMTGPDGELVPAGRVEPTAEGPMHEQRVESVERVARLERQDKSPLVTLVARDRRGAELPMTFDAVALANYGRAPGSPADALVQLESNLNRMVNGPESARYLPDGQNASYVQALRSDFFVPDSVVIFEGDNGPVTKGEAFRQRQVTSAEQFEATRLADRKDALDAQQLGRRGAMRRLIERALNGLDDLSGEARVAQILAINDAMYQAYDGDKLPLTLARKVEAHAEDAAALHDDVARRVAVLEEQIPALTRQREQAVADVAETQRELVTAEASGIAEVIEPTRQVLKNEEHKLRGRERVLRQAEQRLAQSQALLEQGFAQGQTQTAQQKPRNINRNLANLARYRLSDAEVEAFGVDAANLDQLNQRYRRTREESQAISDVLERHARTSPDSDARIDGIARPLIANGMDRDAAYAFAEEQAEIGGLADQEDDGERTSDENEGDGAFSTGAADVSSTEGVVATPQGPKQNPNRSEFEGSQDEQRTDDEQREAYRRPEQRAEQRKALETAMKAFAEAGGTFEQAETGADALTFIYGDPALKKSLEMDYGVRRRIASTNPVHQSANAIARGVAARRAQAEGTPLPETSRRETLAKAFGKDGVRVVGTTDSEAVSSFVKQAMADFRSTDRPVLVTVGRTAEQISHEISANNLLPQNRRKAAIRKLMDHQAGSEPLYMSMGDFVLVALPKQPRKGQAATLRWYHQLGHELGHLVFDDYAQSIQGNRAQREALYAAFQAEHGVPHNADPALFKEWFADQAANEMIAQSFAQADPEQITPFTRLANMMQGLWERVQYLLPRFTRTRSFAQFAEAIRQGQIKRQRMGDDFVVERYDGATDQEMNRTKMAANRFVAAAKKSTAKGGIGETLSRAFTTVVGRLEGYHPELAKRLFQRSATARGEKGASWQQMTNAMRDRFVGAMGRTLADIERGAKTKQAKQAAVTQAFRDLEAGRQTEGARKLATLIDSAIENAEQNGLRSVMHRKDFVPAAIDHAGVDGNRQAFTALLKQAFPNESDAQLQQRIEVLLETHGFSEYAIAPGLPVSTHDTTNHLLETVGVARLREAGFLQEASDAVLHHWVEGLSKRAAWEANFGAHTRTVANPISEHQRVLGIDDPDGKEMRRLGLLDEEGNYWDASGGFKQLMAEVVAEHGVQGETDVRNLLDGVMGRTTTSMPRGLRNVNDWVTAWTGWTVLAFSGIASIPEVGLGAVRAHGRAGLIDGFRGYADARRYAKDMGVVMSDAGERIMWNSMGDQYESPLLNKIGTAFFKYNGTKAITDVNRTMSVSIGTQYLIRSAEMGDSQALEQLGVTAAEVRAWDQAGRPTWQPGGTQTGNNAVAEKVGAALNQFVYESSAMPSKLQNPGWFNNPYMKFAWMIKRYMYAYGETVLMGMWRQGKRGWMRGTTTEQKAFLAAAPAMAFAVAILPLAAAGMELREILRPYYSGRPGREMSDYGGPLQYAQAVFSRSGGFGPLEAVMSMRQQSDWGYSLIGSVSPVVGKAEMLTDWGNDGALSGEEALTRLRKILPLFSQSQTAWNVARAPFE